jgi:hypothetical protein
LAGIRHTIGFVGDLGDPWVALVAESVPTVLKLMRLDCAGDLPDDPFAAQPAPSLIIMHRHRLSGIDRANIKRWRERLETELRPVIFLCVSPYVRYDDLERASGLFDLIVPEGIAPDVLPGRIARYLADGACRQPRADQARSRIEVSGGNRELCRAVADTCKHAGYRVALVDDLIVGDAVGPGAGAADGGDRVLTIWEIPVLEPGWPERLEQRVLATGPVIGLLGFADRATVSRAKSKGAAACLDLPYDREDLLSVIDRAAISFALDAWPVVNSAGHPHHLARRARSSARRDSRSPRTSSRRAD